MANYYNTHLPIALKRGLRRQELNQKLGYNPHPQDYQMDMTTLAQRYPGVLGDEGRMNPDYMKQQAQQQHYQGLRQRHNDAEFMQSLITPQDRRDAVDQSLAQGLYRRKRTTQLMTDPYDSVYNLEDSLYGY